MNSLIGKKGRDRGPSKHRNLDSGRLFGDLVTMVRWGVVEMRMRRGLAIESDGDRNDVTEGRVPEPAPQSNPQTDTKSTQRCRRFAEIDQNPTCVPDLAFGCHGWLKRGPTGR